MKKVIALALIALGAGSVCAGGKKRQSSNTVKPAASKAVWLYSADKAATKDANGWNVKGLEALHGKSMETFKAISAKKKTDKTAQEYQALKNALQTATFQFGQQIKVLKHERRNPTDAELNAAIDAVIVANNKVYQFVPPTVFASIRNYVGWKISVATIIGAAAILAYTKPEMTKAGWAKVPYNEKVSEQALNLWAQRPAFMTSASVAV